MLQEKERFRKYTREGCQKDGLFTVFSIIAKNEKENCTGQEGRGDYIDIRVVFYFDGIPLRLECVTFSGKRKKGGNDNNK